MKKLASFDRAWCGAGRLVMAGVDEAGRGPWAGPVVAAAVVLPSYFRLPGLNDSKLLSPRQRDILYGKITRQALCWAVSESNVSVIDTHNILKATHMAMWSALKKLSFPFQLVLVDGYPLPQELSSGESWIQQGIVRGDRTSACIAAAGILAKVTRDRLMRDYDVLYPDYGFARHKGYGTPEHARALTRYGPCPLHRRSFAPVRASLSVA